MFRNDRDSKMAVYLMWIDFIAQTLLTQFTLTRNRQALCWIQIKIIVFKIKEIKAISGFTDLNDLHSLHNII